MLTWVQHVAVCIPQCVQQVIHLTHIIIYPLLSFSPLLILKWNIQLRIYSLNFFRDQIAGKPPHKSELFRDIDSIQRCAHFSVGAHVVEKGDERRRCAAGLFLLIDLISHPVSFPFLLLFLFLFFSLSFPLSVFFLFRLLSVLFFVPPFFFLWFSTAFFLPFFFLHRPFSVSCLCLFLSFFSFLPSRILLPSITPLCSEARQAAVSGGCHQHDAARVPVGAKALQQLYDVQNL